MYVKPLVFTLMSIVSFSPVLMRPSSFLVLWYLVLAIPGEPCWGLRLCLSMLCTCLTVIWLASVYALSVELSRGVRSWTHCLFSAMLPSRACTLDECYTCRFLLSSCHSL